MTLFFYLATRGQTWAKLPKRPLLLQAVGKFDSPIARASEQSVQEMIVGDSKRYLIAVLRALFAPLGARPEDWVALWRRGDFWSRLTEQYGLDSGTKKASTGKKADAERADLDWIVRQLGDEADPDEVLGELVDKIKDKASLEDYLRLLGVRSGLLYPQQKVARKRLYPEDRVIEVLVAGTTNVIDEVIEYQEFLERLWQRFGIITGGLPDDEYLLAEAGVAHISSKHLRENADAFLQRLEEQGLAKRLADSKAMVGLMETSRSAL